MVCLVYKCSWNIGDVYEKNGSYKSSCKRKREIKNRRKSKKQNIRAFTITEQLTKNIQQIIHDDQNAQEELIPMFSHEQM